MNSDKSAVKHSNSFGNWLKWRLREILSLPIFNTPARAFIRAIRPALPNRLVVRFPITTPVICTLDGLQPFRIVSDVRDPLVRSLYWNGTASYEPAETRVAVAALRECRIVFDIGAYIGWYSLVALSIEHVEAVYGFEPLPATFELYRRNINLNQFRRASIYPFAVGDTSGTAELYVPAEQGMISLEASLTSGFRDSQHQIQVETITLDHFVERHQIARVDFIKIDVETAEARVLRGGKNLLERFEPIIMLEVLPGAPANELMDIFAGTTYRFFNIVENGLSEMPHIEANPANHNWLLVPSHRMQVYIQRLLH